MDLLRQGFRDISIGYTRMVVLGRPAYIRHLRYDDQIGFDEKRDEFYAEARGRGTHGAPTEEDRLKEIIKSGEWSGAKEQEIARAKAYIASLHDGKRRANMPSLVNDYAKRIKEAEQDYAKLVQERTKLLGLTCELFADVEVNDYFIATNLYRDPGLTVSFFDPGEYDYLKPEQMAEITAAYNSAMEAFSDRNLKRLAMQPFFQRYYKLVGDNPSTLFGKPLCMLTFYQVDLLHYGAHFLAIYQNHDVSTWRKEVLEDPDLFTDHAIAVAKGKQDLAAQGADEAGAIVVGAKSEDAKALGIRNSGNPIREITQKFGGNMLEWAAKKG